MSKKIKGSHHLLASNRVTVLSVALNVISQLHKTVPIDVYLSHKFILTITTTFTKLHEIIKMAIILDTAHHLVWMSDITVIIVIFLLLVAHHHCQLLDILCKGA